MLYKILKVKERYFVYDTITNRIFEVSNPQKGETTIRSFHKKLGFESEEVKIVFKATEKEIFNKLKNRLEFINLNITERCNFRCKYCVYSGIYENQRVHSSRTMNLQTAKAAIDFFAMHSKNSKRKVIGFYGGEPLLEFKKITKIVEYATKKMPDVRFSITTNGSLLNKKQVRDFLVKNNFLVGISLDGPEIINDKFRVDLKGKGTYTHVIKGINEFKKEYPGYFQNNVGILSTFTPPYEFQIINEFFSSEITNLRKISLISTIDLKKEFSGFFLGEGKIDIIKKGFEAFRNDLRMKDSKKMIFYQIFFGYFKEILTRPINLISKERHSINALCIPGGDRLFVTTEGNLKICESMENSFTIGSVDKGFDFEKIKFIIKEYLKFANKKCSSCWAVRLCNLCYPYFVRGNKFDESKWEENCKKEKSSLEDYLKFFIEISFENEEIKTKFKKVFL